MRKASFICGFLFCFAFSGCAPVGSVTTRNTAGQPPEYVEGYRAGCASGYVASGHPYAKPEKNVELYISDPVYKTGWDDGFATCKGQYDSTQRMMSY